jgi:hypothetical protein
MRRHNTPIIVCVILRFLLASASAQEQHDVSTQQIGKSVRLVGRLHVPLGDVVVVQGVVVLGQPKGHEKRWNLQVSRVNGVATQEDILMPMSAYSGDWNEESKLINLPQTPRPGDTYEMEGFETGEFEGTPRKAYASAGLLRQDTSFEFCEALVVYRAKRIDPVRAAPSEFKDRRALISGVAHNDKGRAVLSGDSWSVVVDFRQPWPKDVLGREVETYGLYVPSSTNEFALRDGIWRLTRLNDQVGTKVVLRGRARQGDPGIWWFEYRNVDLYVDNVAKLPGWSYRLNRDKIEIRGVLDKVKLPVIDKYTGPSTGGATKEYFIVRDASWRPLDRPLLLPELPHN